MQCKQLRGQTIILAVAIVSALEVGFLNIFRQRLKLLEWNPHVHVLQYIVHVRTSS